MRASSALCLFICACGSLVAQWPNDPATNLAITAATGEEVDPLLAVLPDGSCYVGWFHSVPDPDFFEVRLQLLDPQGVPQFGPDGLLVSDHPHNSFTTGWDLMADSTGAAVLAFTDIRAGEPDVYAYRIDAAGAFLWGPDGVTLTDNLDTELRPFITETVNGRFAFAWTRDAVSGDGDIRLQQLTPQGAPVLPSGGVAIVTQPGQSPSFPDLVPSAGDEVIVSWVPDFGARFIEIAKFDGSGNPIWGPLTVFDTATLQIGYHPILQADDQGGAFMAWYAQDLRVYAQHVTAAGNFLFPAGGALVSTDSSRLRVSPTAAFDASLGDIVVGWTELNTNQSMSGVYAQRLSPSGIRVWGDQGIEVVPLGNNSRTFVQTLDVQGETLLFWLDAPDAVNDLVRGARLDFDGNQIWNMGNPVDLSTVVSGKGRLSAGKDATGTSYAIWNDERDGDSNVYGQNITLSGDLGSGASCPGDCAGADGVVNEDDLAEAIAAWTMLSDCELNNLAMVDIGDLIALITLFGECP